MRLWTLLLIAAVIGSAQTEKKQERSGSESSSAKTTVVKLPVNAVRIADGLYRYADTHGNVWLYRRTPFGYAKSEEGQVKAATEDAVRTGDAKGTPFSGAATGERAPAKSSSALITATEEGENIRFERPTPFGKTRWVKHKSELTAEETRIWESQKPQPSEPDGK